MRDTAAISTKLLPENISLVDPMSTSNDTAVLHQYDVSIMLEPSQLSCPKTQTSRRKSFHRYFLRIFWRGVQLVGLWRSSAAPRRSLIRNDASAEAGSFQSMSSSKVVSTLLSGWWLVRPNQRCLADCMCTLILQPQELTGWGSWYHFRSSN